MRKTEYEIDQIIANLRGRHISTSRDQMIRAEIDRLLRRDPEGNLIPEPRRFSGGIETRGIVVTGGPGSGKTTILNNVLSNHPALGAQDGAPPRYLSLGVPSPATLKSLGCEILRMTDYPEVSERRERWSIWGLVRHRLAMLGIVCLVIDEAHDLNSAGSLRETLDIFSAFKSLLKADPPIIVILSGVPVLQELISVEGQTQRRYAKIALPTVSGLREEENLSRAINEFCRIAGIAPPEVAVVPRLVHASRGMFGMCIENLINAIEAALRVGDDKLELLHFAESWAMTNQRPDHENPFLADRFSTIRLEPEFNPMAWRRK